MAYFGNRRTTPDAQWGVTTSPTTSNQRATIFGPFPEDGWATKVGVWGGRYTGTNPVVSLAVWNADSSGNVLSGRRGYTDTFNPATLMLDSVSGASYEANLTHMNSGYSPSDLSMKVNAGDYYGIGFLATTAQFAHGMSNTTRALHKKNVSAQPPTSPFDASSTTTELVMSVWMEYTPNTAPSAPSTGMAPTGNISSSTPTFTANYVDAQIALGDEMKSYKIQLRQVGTTALLWNQEYTASVSEQNASAVSRAYGGSTLSAGVNYEWRIQVTDQHDWDSDYSAWQSFTITSGVGVLSTTGATPNGKQNAVNGYTFQGYWTHGGSLAMTHVTCDILEGGVLSQRKEYDIANVASSASPGTFFSATFANFGFTDLSFGRSYTWRMKGKDSSGVYSAYSSEIAFTTNTVPTTPTGLTPGSSASTSSLPKLEMTMTDADDTPVALGGVLTATCKIKSTPVDPNALFTSDIGGWVASNSGDTAGATVAWTWQNTELSATDWTGVGYMKADVTANSAAASTSVYHSDRVGIWTPCVVGETYSVSADVWTTNANLVPSVMIMWYDSSKALLSTSRDDSYVPVANALNVSSFSAVAPANAAFFRIGVFIRTLASSATGICYFKEIEAGTASVRTSRTMTYNPTTSKWEYQTLKGTDDVQTVSFGGTVTGGNWSFTFNGVTSANIAYNASAATVQTALQAMSTIGTDNVIVTGGPGPGTAYVLTFANELGGAFQNAATVNNVSLTGTAPTVSIAHTTSGTSSDIGHTGKYWWDAQGSDTVNTGGTAAQAAFFYVNGPTVTITSHTDGGVITTSRPTITWTATNQLKYQLYVYQADTTTVVYNSGLITSGIQSHQIPSGYLSNGNSYDFQVYVTNTSNAVGANTAITLTLTFGAPPELAFTATPAAVGLDTEESAVICAWELSAQPPSLFESYILSLRETGQSVEDEIIIRRITNINQGTFIYYFPASGKDYTFALRQAALDAADSSSTVEGNRTEASASVAFNSAIITSIVDSGSNRAVLRYVTDYSSDHKVDQQPLMTWGNSAPIILEDATDYEIVSGTFTIVADNVNDAKEYLNALRTVWRTKKTVCWRDDEGRKFFGRLTSFKEKDVIRDQFEVSLEFSETDYSEGQ